MKRRKQNTLSWLVLLLCALPLSLALTNQVPWTPVNDQMAFTPSSARALQGEQFIITLKAKVPPDVTAATFVKANNILYDPSVLTVVRTEISPPLATWSFGSGFTFPSPGKINFQKSATAEQPTVSGEFDIGTITFEVSNSAVAGETLITLSEVYSTDTKVVQSSTNYITSVSNARITIETAECFSPTDCAPRECYVITGCSAGTCVYDYTTNPDESCGTVAGQICRTEAEGCGCPSGTFEDGGSCVSGGSVPVGGACTQNEVCASLICEAGICRGREGDSCSADYEGGGSDTCASYLDCIEVYGKTAGIQNKKCKDLDNGAPLEATDLSAADGLLGEVKQILRKETGSSYEFQTFRQRLSAIAGKFRVFYTLTADPTDACPCTAPQECVDIKRGISECRNLDGGKLSTAPDTSALKKMKDHLLDTSKTRVQRLALTAGEFKKLFS